MFEGADFSKTSKYSLLRKMFSTAKLFQFSGSAETDEYIFMDSGVFK